MYKLSIFIISTVLLLIAIYMFFVQKLPFAQHESQADLLTLQNGSIENMITASGDVESENQVTLSFLNAGRVSTVNVKEGDTVKKGEILASLDTTIAEKNVEIAQADYNSAKAALDQVLDDIHQYQYGNGGFSNVGSANETQAQKTKREEAESAVNTAYNNLQIAQKNLELLTIVAPFEGKVLKVNNLAVGENITLTSSSSITVVGAGKLKFVADVASGDLNHVKAGDRVTINLDSFSSPLNGTVTIVAPDSTKLANGENVYLADIQSDDLQSTASAGQLGTVIIKDSTDSTGSVAPAWAVLANKYLWVEESGKAILKQVTVGQNSGENVQISTGLQQNDKLILNPELIVKEKYLLP